ncbi:hypothetical protein SKAU_G00110260 [Synaphobranchus kaupii]|uniref:Uncharacterized protein n=1 Tax=Synaphobranchus kaupii TaxID=118154 RepID=A0A9Q1J8E0_SYNKA|nr:hypothetical protein SKAU_G00110260 [Synaphobranchus kaupii]
MTNKPKSLHLSEIRSRIFGPIPAIREPVTSSCLIQCNRDALPAPKRRSSPSTLHALTPKTVPASPFLCLF